MTPLVDDAAKLAETTRALEHLFIPRNKRSGRSPLERAFRKSYRQARRTYYALAAFVRQKVALPVKIARFPKNIDYIKTVTENTDWSGDTFGLFVYYEKTGQVSNSVIRLLTAMQSAGVDVVVLANSSLSPPQRATLLHLSACVVERQNVGQDIGAYKDGVAFLTRKLDARAGSVKRVIFMNDSLFFLENGLLEFIAALCDNDDVIFACENYAHYYHLQSFAFSVAGSVFKNADFQSFWTNYAPLSDRYHAIMNGELGISNMLLKISTGPRVLYSAENLRGMMEHVNSDPMFWYYRLGLRRGKALDDHLFDIARDGLRFDILTVLIARAGFFIAGAYPMVRVLGCPFIKKGLLRSAIFSAEQLELILPEIMSDNEFREFVAEVIVPHKALLASRKSPKVAVTA